MSHAARVRTQVCWPWAICTALPVGTVREAAVRGTHPFPLPLATSRAGDTCSQRRSWWLREAVQPARGSEPSGRRETWRLRGWFLAVLSEARSLHGPVPCSPAPPVRPLSKAPAVCRAPGSPSEPVWLLPSGPPDLGGLGQGAGDTCSVESVSEGVWWTKAPPCLGGPGGLPGGGVV